MGSIRLLVLCALCGVTLGAIQPGPVYHRPTTIVSSVSMVPSGKSLPTGNSPGPMSPLPNMNFQQDVQQPLAEERQIQDGAVVGSDEIGSTGVAVPSAPQQSQVNPQTFKIWYYPNTGPLTNPQGTNYQAPTNPIGSPENTEVSPWEKYHLTDAIVGIFTIAMVAGGGYLLVPKIVNAATRGRSLRELAQDFNSDDAARLARSVIQAVERLYELNNAE